MVERARVRRRNRPRRDAVACVEIQDAVVEHRGGVALPEQQRFVGDVAQAHRRAVRQRTVGAQDRLDALVIERVRDVEGRVTTRMRRR